MTYTFTPRGVCSRRMTVELEDGIIKDVKVEGGCSGNLQGISRLVVGMRPPTLSSGCRAFPAAESPPPAPTSWPRH